MAWALPADRSRRPCRLSRPRGSGKGDDYLRACRQREDVAAARLGRAPGPGASRRLRAGSPRRAGCSGLLACPAQRGPPSPGAASDTEPPAATPDFDARTLADRVFSELADQRDRVMIVIDDLHELNSPESLDQLTRLLGNLPPKVHAIVATRHDLRLRLHQLRLAGELAEIRAAHLRFTERETASFSPPQASRFPRPTRRCCTSGQKGGPRDCGWRRFPWPVTPTRSVSLRSSPAASARSPST